MTLRTIELFSGTKSFSKAMEEKGHATFTVDNDPSLHPDICLDLSTAGIQHLTLGNRGRSYPDILWASPPCQGFSVAAIGKNWNIDNTPKTDSARMATKIVKNLLGLIVMTEPRWWFIENPRGKLRSLKLIEEAFPNAIRHTISYCQYGDTRMKPTDIWTNATWWHPKEICKNGMPCHEAAPRGAKTGTQGIEGARDRGRIPAALFEEILEQMPSVSGYEGYALCKVGAGPHSHNPFYQAGRRPFKRVR